MGDLLLKFALLFGFWGGFWVHTWAQDLFLDIPIRKYSIERGLSQSNVTTILQDHKGFIWVGTQNGLNRFDAYDFKSLGTQNGLSDGYVSTLYQSRDGKIWIGNPSGIVDILDPETFQISSIEIPFQQQGSRGITRFMEDTEGKMWITTRNGVYVWDAVKETFYQFSDKGELRSRLSYGSAYGMIQDSNGDIWVACQNGLLCLKEIRFGENGELDAELSLPGAKHPYLKNGLVFKIIPSKRGGFWINNWQKGILYYHHASDTYEFYPVISQEEKGEVVELYEIMEDQEGNVWASSKNHGLIKLDHKTRQIQYLRYNANNTQALGSNTLMGLAEDREGGIWVGTYGAGLNYFHPQTPQFIHYKMDAEPRGLSFSLVYALHASRFDESVWVGTHGGGLNQVLGKNNIRHFLPDPSHPNSLKDDVVIDIEEDGEGNLWVGTYHGLSILPVDRKEESYGKLVFEGEFGDSLAWNILEKAAIWSLLYDSKGRMWVGTDQGLFRRDEPRKAWIHYRTNSADPYGLKDSYIRELYEDPNGNIWFPTARGLHRYREASQDFQIYGTEGKDVAKLSSNSSYCVVADYKGRIWLGTQGEGLNAILPQEGYEEVRVRRFFESDGLPSNMVMGLLADDAGHIWASTSKGLFRFHPDSLLKYPHEVTRQLRTYKEYDGLQSDEFLEGSFSKDKHGRLYFGGVNGYNVFDPNEFQVSKQEVPVFMTELKVLNQSVGIGEELRTGEMPLDKALEDKRQLNLSWRDYFFSLTFTALGYQIPEKSEYAYRMDGLNEDWYFIGAQRTATFTNLAPGNYVLRVKARNQDGFWNEAETRLNIHISTPPWQSWWAYCIYVLMIAGAIGAYIRYRIREREKELATKLRIEQVKIEERELVRKNTAADFHDELGNKMTKISLFIELAKRAESANETLQVYLNQVEENTQILSQGIRDFIWVLDPEKDSVYDMLIRIKDFGDELFDHTEVSFICEGIHPDQIKYKLPLNSRRHLMLIAKEAMNNALKYAEAKQVTCKAEIKGNQFRLEIADDGKGFDPEKVNKGYGLKNINNRSEKIGAIAEIVTDLEQGTRIKVTLDLPHMGD